MTKSTEIVAHVSDHIRLEIVHAIQFHFHFRTGKSYTVKMFGKCSWAKSQMVNYRSTVG